MSQAITYQKQKNQVKKKGIKHTDAFIFLFLNTIWITSF